MVNAAHSVVKYSERIRRKYLRLVRRLGKNRAIVAIARILIETIYTMLSREHISSKTFSDPQNGRSH